jgi:hypothetical protein
MARKIKITVDTGFAGAEHEDECELPDDWDAMPEDERQDFLAECCADAIANFIDAYAEVVND